MSTDFIAGFIVASVWIIGMYCVSKIDFTNLFKKKPRHHEEFIDKNIDNFNDIAKYLISNYIKNRSAYERDEQLAFICDECSKFYNRNMRIEVSIFRRFNTFCVSYTFYAIGLKTFSIGYTSNKIEFDEYMISHLPSNGDEGYHHKVLTYSSKIYD